MPPVSQDGDSRSRNRRSVLLPGEAFDDLTKAAAGCATRRGVLKVLLLGLTGAVAGPDLLAACTSTPRQPPARALAPTRP